MKNQKELMVLYRLSSLASTLKSCNNSLIDTRAVFEENEDVVDGLIEDPDFEDLIMTISDELNELDARLEDYELAGVLF